MPFAPLFTHYMRNGAKKRTGLRLLLKKPLSPSFLIAKAAFLFCVLFRAKWDVQRVAVNVRLR